MFTIETVKLTAAMVTLAAATVGLIREILAVTRTHSDKDKR